MTRPAAGPLVAVAVAASAVAAVAVAAVLPAAPVGAHEGGPGVTVVVDAVEPPLPAGVRIEVVESLAAQLVAANPTPTPLTILGAAGEPFLRIAADGAYANVGSPSWAASNSPDGAPGRPGPERFVRVSREPSWGWFDHRLHPERVVRSPAAAVVRLGEWAVPFRYGDRAGSVRGHVELRPVRGAYRARLTEPPPAGVEATVLPGRVPGLFVRASRAVTVSGAAGEPFLRLDPARGTEVNAASPTYVADAQLRGRTPTVPADPAAPPRWQPVSGQPAYGWLDRRLAYAGPEPAVADRVLRVADWRVPVTDGVLAGVVEWVPADPAPARRGRVPWPWLVLAGLVLAVGAVGLARGRPGR